jgi:hypothetical protein
MAIRKIPPVAIAVIGIVGIVLTLTTLGLVSINQSVSNSGTITSVNVGVYSDSGCTTNCTSISWGSISPNSTVTKTVYVKNTGTAQIKLNMTTNTWSPANANGPITLTWNQEGATLNASQVATTTLTLGVSASISGVTTFSFNIVITGTG